MNINTPSKNELYTEVEHPILSAFFGLKEKNTDGMRLGADGKSELTLRLSVINASFLDYPGVAELLVRHWRELGLRIDARLQERSLFTKLNESNKQQMLLWEAGGSEGIWYYPSFTIPIGFAYIGPAGGQWYQSRGKIGIEPNEHAVYLDVKQHLANKRQGTHKAKERAEITGSTRKIKKQKGTGTARAGSIKSPIFKGGGRVFGPRPRNYGFKLNKSLKKLRSASTSMRSPYMKSMPLP